MNRAQRSLVLAMSAGIAACATVLAIPDRASDDSPTADASAMDGTVIVPSDADIEEAKDAASEAASDAPEEVPFVLEPLTEEGLWAPNAFALSADSVFFDDFSDRDIRRVPKAGGTVSVVTSTEPYDILSMVADQARVCWTPREIQADNPLHKPMCAPVAGGVATPLFDSGGSVSGIAANATHVYVAQAFDGRVRRILKPGADGGSAVTAVSTLPSPSFIWQIALQGELVLVAAESGVFRGSSTMQFVQVWDAIATSVHADASRVYWGNLTTIRSARLDATLGSGSRIEADAQTAVRAIVGDQDRLYWSTDGEYVSPGYRASGTIMTCRKSDCLATTRTLADRVPLPRRMAMDETHVYVAIFGAPSSATDFGTPGAGVYRFAKLR